MDAQFMREFFREWRSDLARMDMEDTMSVKVGDTVKMRGDPDEDTFVVLALVHDGVLALGPESVYAQYIRKDHLIEPAPPKAVPGRLYRHLRDVSSDPEYVGLEGGNVMSFHSRRALVYDPELYKPL